MTNRRNLGLVDSHPPGSFPGRQALALNDRANLVCQFRLGEQFVRIGKAQVGEYVAIADLHYGIGGSNIDSR